MQLIDIDFVIKSSGQQHVVCFKEYKCVESSVVDL